MFKLLKTKLAFHFQVYSLQLTYSRVAWGGCPSPVNRPDIQVSLNMTPICAEFLGGDSSNSLSLSLSNMADSRTSSYVTVDVQSVVALTTIFLFLPKAPDSTGQVTALLPTAH